MKIVVLDPHASSAKGEFAEVVAAHENGPTVEEAACKAMGWAAADTEPFGNLEARTFICHSTDPNVHEVCYAVIVD